MSCAPKDDFPAVITAYLRAENQWSDDRRTPEVPMKCIHCHGGMKPATAPFHVDWHGYHLLLDTVPAWVCGQCGEAYFESREVEAIQEAIRVLDRQARRLAADAAPGTA